MYVYILYSRSLQKHYVGQTKDLSDRLNRHNGGREKFTKNGVPWNLVWSQSCSNRREAIILERKIKKRGASRFLKDNHFGV